MKIRLQSIWHAAFYLTISLTMACSGQQSGDAIVGTWQLEGQEFGMTINANGTISSAEDTAREAKIKRCKAGGSDIKMEKSIWRTSGDDYEIGGPGLDLHNLGNGKMKCNWSKAVYNHVTVKGDTLTLKRGDGRRLKFKRK